MSITPERFRRVLRHLAGGVAIVTSRDREGGPCGLTATAVCSVSLEPPLVLACLDVGTNTHRAVDTAGLFALNLLSREDEELAERFGRDDPDKFEGVEFRFETTGAPVLGGTLGYCDCSVFRSVPAGDHTIFIGRVEAAELRESGRARPLVYYRGRFSTVAADSGAAAE